MAYQVLSEDFLQPAAQKFHRPLHQRRDIIQCQYQIEPRDHRHHTDWYHQQCL